MINIYLAGPIEGCNDNEINDWRDKVKGDFLYGIKGINPYRAEEVGTAAFETKKRIITKNYLDIKNCDGVLAWLPVYVNKRRPSYGTTTEIAWAYSLQKPIWIVSDDDFVHFHPAFDYTSMLFRDLEDAIDHINVIFGEYL
jgi:nucleoside 2-deoxyribosyltransferase